jgi:hypothetical protein
MKCPVCEGEGEFREYTNYQLSNRYKCNYCKGEGTVSIFKWLGFHFWEKAPEWMFDLYVKIFEGKE